MPSYLEIALRVAGAPHHARDKQESPASQPLPIPAHAAARQEVSVLESLAACGSSHCAGCYEVEPTVRIHPPKKGEDWIQ